MLLLLAPHEGIIFSPMTNIADRINSILTILSANIVDKQALDSELVMLSHEASRTIGRQITAENLSEIAEHATNLEWVLGKLTTAPQEYERALEMAD